MRPKKRILIASSFEMRTSLLRFTLTTNRFAVAIATHEAEAEARLQTWSPDLVIVDLPFSGHPSLLDRLDDLGWHRPVIALGKREDISADIGFDLTLPREYSPTVLLEHIRAMSVRKPGPRQFRKPVLSVPAFAAVDQAVNL